MGCLKYEIFKKENRADRGKLKDPEGVAARGVCWDCPVPALRWPEG